MNRIENVLQSVRLQNSGADIHDISNIRHTVSLLKDQVLNDPECLSEELAEQIIKNMETKVADFFRNKYLPRYLSDSPKNDRINK